MFFVDVLLMEFNTCAQHVLLFSLLDYIYMVELADKKTH